MDNIDDLKKNWHLFYATCSFVHHFAAICEFKLELHSGNAQIGVKFGLTSDEHFMMMQWEKHC